MLDTEMQFCISRVTLRILNVWIKSGVIFEMILKIFMINDVCILSLVWFYLKSYYSWAPFKNGVYILVEVSIWIWNIRYRVSNFAKCIFKAGPLR